MKASILAIFTASLILTGCSEEENQANITAVNLVHNELDIIWYDKNNDQQVSLATDYALEYGQATGSKTLYQDEGYNEEYSFKGVDGNAFDNIIVPKTNIIIGDEKTAVLFAYGMPDGGESQQPQFDAVYLNDDEIKTSQYRTRFIHAFPSYMGELKIFINNQLIDQAIEYGEVTKSIDLNIDNNLLEVTKSHSNEVILSKTLTLDAGSLSAIFIAPAATDDLNMDAFTVIHQLDE